MAAELCITAITGQSRLAALGR